MNESNLRKGFFGLPVAPGHHKGEGCKDVRSQCLQSRRTEMNVAAQLLSLFFTFYSAWESSPGYHATPFQSVLLPKVNLSGILLDMPRDVFTRDSKSSDVGNRF